MSPLRSLQSRIFLASALLTVLSIGVAIYLVGVRVNREVEAGLQRDIVSLTDHATFLSGKISFLLDAVLGLISIEQNGIIKIFSVAAVVFLPPTLVASIYGMNFAFMPELQWQLGYPFALGLMVLSAGLPYYYFKGKGWDEYATFLGEYVTQAENVLDTTTYSKVKRTY